MQKQLTIYATKDLIERIAELFFEFGALATTICDANEGTDSEELIFDEPNAVFSAEQALLWQHSVLYVLLDYQTDVSSITMAIYEVLGQQFEYTETDLPNQDWVGLSQQQHEIIEISHNFVIASQWHEVPAGSTAVILNPGLAFGSGTHPTTRLCLEWLVHHPPLGKAVLDFGCGSGILAITAAKLGAQEVVGVDIDAQAIVSSRYNAQLNNVVADFMMPELLPAGRKFAVVVANILANPLKELAELLASYASESLIISGILEQQAAEMVRVYQPYFTKIEQKHYQGWSVLCCQREQ